MGRTGSPPPSPSQPARGMCDRSAVRVAQVFRSLLLSMRGARKIRLSPFGKREKQTPFPKLSRKQRGVGPLLAQGEGSGMCSLNWLPLLLWEVHLRDFSAQAALLVPLGRCGFWASSKAFPSRIAFGASAFRSVVRPRRLLPVVILRESSPQQSA